MALTSRPFNSSSISSSSSASHLAASVSCFRASWAAARVTSRPPCPEGCACTKRLEAGLKYKNELDHNGSIIFLAYSIHKRLHSLLNLELKSCVIYSDLAAGCIDVFFLSVLQSWKSSLVRMHFRDEWASEATYLGERGTF